MRLLKTLVLAVSLVAMSAAVASANSLSLVATGATGDVISVAGSTVNCGALGCNASFDIILNNNTTGIAAIGISGAYPGGNGSSSGLTEGFVFFGAGFMAPLGLQWNTMGATSGAGLNLGANPAGAGVPVGISAGCNCKIGSISVNTSSSTSVTVGVLTGSDGAFDNLFVATSMASGVGQINVVPEPGTVLLMGLGLVGLTVAGRRE